MSKDKMRKVYGHYIPHFRGRPFRNEVVNPFTGEVKVPPSRTKQEFVRESDVNNIIKAYTLTGQITHISKRAAQGAYLDLPDSLDYQESLNTVLQAERSFMSLPSGIRNRFENDPAQFLAFMTDPRNQDEIIKLGLARDTRPPDSNLGGAEPGKGEAKPSSEGPAKE